MKTDRGDGKTGEQAGRHTQTGVTNIYEDGQPDKLIHRLKSGLTCRQTGKQRDRQETKACLIHLRDKASTSFCGFVTALSFDQ